MDKTKIIPVILLVIILGVGFVAFTFYTQKENLVASRQQLEEKKISLSEENTNLKYKYTKLNKEKSDIERRLMIIEEKLSDVEVQKEDWKNKWSTVTKERDALAEKAKYSTGPVIKTVKDAKEERVSEDHWADFVRDKASLEAKLSVLNKELFNKKVKIEKLIKENEEVIILKDQLASEKVRLIEEIKFKERTLRIISMDLVNERESRNNTINEAKKLRQENESLKRELVVANRELIKLQGTFKGIIDKKEVLEDKIAAADNILKEKTLAFDQLQKQLTNVISEEKNDITKEVTSVELPPITVEPVAQAVKQLQGEVIAVNHEEKFIVVDIGESSGLKPGALLKITRGSKNVGTAEVIEVRKEISAADIKEVIGGYIIQEGDVIITR